MMEIGGQIGLKGERNKAERLGKHLQRKGWRRFEKRESGDDRGGFEAAREGGGKWGMTERKVGSRGKQLGKDLGGGERRRELDVRKALRTGGPRKRG